MFFTLQLSGAKIDKWAFGLASGQDSFDKGNLDAAERQTQ
jgi:hypothetical protein